MYAHDTSSCSVGDKKEGLIGTANKTLLYLRVCTQCNSFKISKNENKAILFRLKHKTAIEKNKLDLNSNYIEISE